MNPQLARSAFLLLYVICDGPVLSSQLPNGKGKDVVESTCTECHTLERVKAQRRDEEGWNAIIREMIETGAQIDSNDISTIVAYLAKNFGPDKKVNVNTAPASEIAGVLGIEPEAAKAIVTYRKRHGKLKELTDVKKVSGVAEKIEAKKALIEF
jgi:competence ComEA-like helix-hairpin-helix protein